VCRIITLLCRHSGGGTHELWQFSFRRQSSAASIVDRDYHNFCQVGLDGLLHGYAASSLLISKGKHESMTCSHRLSRFALFFPKCSVPFAVVRWYQEQVEDDDDDRELRFPRLGRMVDSDLYRAAQMTGLASGSVLTVFYALLGMASCSRILMARGHRFSSRFDSWGYRWKFVRRMYQWMHWMAATSTARGETCLKQAARYKIQTMLDNAFDLHDIPGKNKYNMSVVTLTPSSPYTAAAATTQAPPFKMTSQSSTISSERALRNFVLDGERFESCGGFFWTWRRILTGTLFSREGIWINTRLIVMQVTQIVVAAVVSIFLLAFIENVADRAETARKSLAPNTPSWVADLIPTRQMIYRSLYPATFIAILVMALLIAIYIPRFVLQCYVL